MSEFTQKQVRNGADQGSPGHNSAVANEGPMPAIPMGAAQAAAARYSDTGRAVFDGEQAGGTVSFEWDAGLAVNDVEGGMSG